MPGRSLSPEAISRLVEHMFEQVLDTTEREQLLDWIHAWEAENPGVDSAHRITGWIDVAYAYQAARRGMESEVHFPWRVPRLQAFRSAAFA